MRRFEVLETRNLLTTDFITHLIAEPEVAELSHTLAGDVDGDGDNDLLILHREGREVAMFENKDGRGGFGAPKTIAVIDGSDPPRTHPGDRMVLSDLDADGDLDLIVNSDKLRWYQNDGQGVFTLRYAESIPGRIVAFDVGDIDGDETLDIALTNGTGVYWLRNASGTGQFGQPSLIWFWSPGSVGEVSLGDFDQDGDLDILASASSDRKVILRENLDGQGQFGGLVELPIDLRDVTAIFADYDQDGDLDILAYSAGSISWYENQDGIGTLGRARHVGDAWLRRFDPAVLVDVDRDGDLDYVAPDAWWENRPGQLGPAKHDLVRGRHHTGARVVSDLDGDGVLDLAMTSTTNVVWRKSIGSFGAFADDVPLTTGSLSVLGDLVVGDIDGDGALDVVTTTLTDGKVAWYQNLDGAGNFGPQQLINDSDRLVRSTRLADFDLDGDLDVVTQLYTDGAVVWQENLDGKGTFGPQRQLAGQGTNRIEIADVNTDGQPDVLGFASMSLDWYRNSDGLGEYPRRIVESVGWDVYSPEYGVGDVDNDGDIDIVMSEERNEWRRLAWLENVNGSGEFVEHAISAEVTYPGRLILIDINNDAKLDLLVQYPGGFHILTFVTADNTFETSDTASITLDDNVWTIKTTDMDADGDQDVVFGQGRNRVSWLENQSDGNMIARTLFELEQDEVWRTFAVGDLDGDGDVDVVGGPDGGNAIYWNESYIGGVGDVLGDADGDGQVGFADFLLLSANFGKTDAVWDHGDFDRDGRVTFADFLLLSRQFASTRV